MSGARERVRAWANHGIGIRHIAVNLSDPQYLCGVRCEDNDWLPTPYMFFQDHLDPKKQAPPICADCIEVGTLRKLGELP